MLYLMTVGRWLLPDRGIPGGEDAEHVGRYVAELLVPEGSDAIGLRREQVVPETIDDATVLEILREGRRWAGCRSWSRPCSAARRWWCSACSIRTRPTARSTGA